MKIRIVPLALIISCLAATAAYADSSRVTRRGTFDPATQQLINDLIDESKAEVAAELVDPPIQLDVCILKKHGSCGGQQSNCDTGNTCQDHETRIGPIVTKSCKCKKKPTQSMETSDGVSQGAGF